MSLSDSSSFTDSSSHSQGPSSADAGPTSPSGAGGQVLQLGPFRWMIKDKAPVFSGSREMTLYLLGVSFFCSLQVRRIGLCACRTLHSHHLCVFSVPARAQGIMTSTALVGHVCCLPPQALPVWLSRYSMLACCPGLLLVPAVATLGAAVVTYVDAVHGSPFSLVVLGAYFALGIACLSTSGVLIRGHVVIRRALAATAAPAFTRRL